MKFDYEMRRSDIVKFNIARFLRTWALPRFAAIYFLLVAAGLTLFQYFWIGMLYLPWLIWGILLAAALTVLVVVLRYGLAIFVVSRRVDEQSGTIGPQELEFLPTGISVSNVASSGTINWSTVRSIKTFGDYIAIEVAKLQYILLPRRIFTSDEEFESAVDELNEIRSQAS